MITSFILSLSIAHTSWTRGSSPSRVIQQFSALAVVRLVALRLRGCCLKAPKRADDKRSHSYPTQKLFVAGTPCLRVSDIGISAPGQKMPSLLSDAPQREMSGNPVHTAMVLVRQRVLVAGSRFPLLRFSVPIHFILARPFRITSRPELLDYPTPYSIFPTPAH